MLLDGTPATAADPDLVHACQSVPRGGLGGVLRVVSAGESCRTGETAIQWPAGQPVPVPRAVVRDAADQQVGEVIGVDALTVPVVHLTVDGLSFALRVTGDELVGALLASQLYWSGPQCQGTAMIPGFVVPSGTLILPAFVRPDPVPPGLSVLVPDRGQGTVGRDYESRSFPPACLEDAGSLFGSVVLRVIELPYTPPFAFGFE
jgi:hypothetical protein